MANVHREGFTRLSGGNGSDGQFSLNVIFVHGLRGHPRGTWETAPATSSEPSSAHDIDETKKHKSPKFLFKSFFKPQAGASPPTGTDQSQASNYSSKIFWPEQYLAPDIPQARIWTYGYNADVIGGLFQANNRNGISQHGRDLEVRLERDIEDEKPIVFVAHSLGGIIVKDAIHRSKRCRERTKLIIFLGTPHRGSMYAGWGQIAANLARVALQDANKKILETLEVNSEVLDNIHENFKNLVFKGGMKIHSFQEAKGIAGIKGLDGKVVDDFSSKLDLPRELETVESIDANHMQMARYCSKDEHGYRAISGVLKSFVRQELDGKGTSPARHADVSSPDVLFTVPFSRDDFFIGRGDIIANISEKRKQAASRNHTRIALVGLGGIGKSQIAIEYVYRVQQVEPQTLVVWIHASSLTRFEQGYRNIADKIPIPGREDPKADILQLVCAWLSDRRNGQWLMILDNADDDSVFFAADKDSTGTAQINDITSYTRPLESFLPQTPNGMILITSRNRVAAINLVGTRGSIIQVEPMDEEDALALLSTRVPFSESSRADAKALVQALEHIPLAITHAAAYIDTSAPMTTLSDYLELFRKSEANQVRLLGKKVLEDLRRDHSIRHAVIATLQISFAQIQKTEQSAADLLALMSMFDRQGVPISLLQNNTSQLDFGDALAPLLSFSLVRAEIGKQSFEMHRLVQLSMKSWLKTNEQLSKWVKESIKVLTAAFPSGGYETWTDCQVLLPHAREAIRHVTGDEEDVLNQAKIAFSAGWYLYLRGEYETAEKVVRMSVEVREKVRGREHLDTLTSVNDLGLILEKRGEYEEAEAMHRRALKGKEKVLGPEHPDTLTSVNNLGLVLKSQGKYEEAEAMYRRALKRYEKVLGPEHPYTLTCVDNLGLVLRSQGKREGAEEMHRRALKGYEKVLGPEHPDTLTSVDNLGLVLGGQGRYEEAEAMHWRALKGKEKVLGSEHPDTLTSVNNLGLVLKSQGKYEEAEAMYRRALKGKEKVLGPEHPYTLTGVNNLGLVLKSRGKYEEAEAMYRRALKGSEKVLGPEHPDTLTSINNFGLVLKSQGKYEEAEAMHRRALKGREKVLGPEHPYTLTCVDNLGLVLKSRGKYEEAEAMHRRALKGREKVLRTRTPRHAH
ncbi:MAG: hypothetical protein M1840_008399 [Geoglossum simile]|nr:MAG: hypothetical protein M1840_008399 [Geoglossum simile]